MDSGRKRTPADALYLRGYKNTNLLSAITSAAIRLEIEGLRSCLQNRGSRYVSATTVVGRVEREPSLVDLAALAHRYRETMLTGRTFGILYYVFSAIDPSDAEDFMSKLSSGADMAEGDPILTLRNKLIWIRQQRAHESQEYIGAIVIKAWNAYRQGRDLRLLKFTPGGANPEKFPQVR